MAAAGQALARAEQPIGNEKEVQLEGSSGGPGDPEPDHPMVQLWQKRQQKTLSWD
jgi:hypothetical protein